MRLFQRELIAPLLLCAALCVAVPSYAAEAGGKDTAIDNSWYSLKLANGWQKIDMPAAPGTNSLSVLVVNQALKSGASITTFTNPLTSKELADTTVTNMKASGAKVGDLNEKDGIYSTTFDKGKEKGEIYFGANGKECAVISVFGNSLQDVKDFLKALEPKPSSKDIFPAF